MSDQDKDLPSEEGNFDWESLEAKSAKQNPEMEEYDRKAIENEKGKLSSDEKDLPYPEDFLADINLLSKSLKESKVNQEEDLEGGEES